jgi:hypothetical protein
LPTTQIPEHVDGREYFNLPRRYETSRVLRRFDAAAADPEGHTEAGSTALQWLKRKHFVSITTPVLMSYWHANNVPGATDFFSIVSYDALHCFFLGELGTSETPPSFAGITLCNCLLLCARSHRSSCALHGHYHYDNQE